MSRSEFPRIRRSRDTGTMDSPIEETAREVTGSDVGGPDRFCDAAFTAFPIVRRMRVHTSEGSNSNHPGRGRTMSYSSYAKARDSPFAENTEALQPVVPTSIPRKLMRRTPIATDTAPVGP